MSSVTLHKEVCPKCGKEQIVERYDSVNDYHQDLFSKIADKSIFDYECESCKEKIHAPYPLLFHKMGIRDIQIGYKTNPIQPTVHSINLFVIATKKLMEDAGHEAKDISECYDNEEEFAKRVASFIN